MLPLFGLNTKKHSFLYRSRRGLKPRGRTLPRWGRVYLRYSMGGARVLRSLYQIHAQIPFSVLVPFYSPLLHRAPHPRVLVTLDACQYHSATAPTGKLYFTHPTTETSRTCLWVDRLSFVWCHFVHSSVTRASSNYFRGKSSARDTLDTVLPAVRGERRRLRTASLHPGSNAVCGAGDPPESLHPFQLQAGLPRECAIYSWEMIFLSGCGCPLWREAVVLFLHSLFAEFCTCFTIILLSHSSWHFYSIFLFRLLFLLAFNA